MCIPKAPKIPSPPASPELPQAPSEVDPSVLAARSRARKQATAQSGAASTIITGGRGVTEGANVAEPSILGGKGASEGALVGRKTPEEEEAAEALRKKIATGTAARSNVSGAGGSPSGGGTILGGSGANPTASTGGGFVRPSSRGGVFR